MILTPNQWLFLKQEQIEFSNQPGLIYFARKAVILLGAGVSGLWSRVVQTVYTMNFIAKTMNTICKMC